MRIQVVNRYLELAEVDLAPVILCGNDKQHGTVFARMSGDDIELWCLACDYRSVVGLGAYNSMNDTVWLYDGIKDV